MQGRDVAESLRAWVLCLQVDAHTLSTCCPAGLRQMRMDPRKSARRMVRNAMADAAESFG